MTETPKYRWLLRTIREAVLAILAVGFALAWYNERNAWAPVRNCIDSVRSDAPSSGQDGCQTDCEISGTPLTIIVSHRGKP